MEKWETFIEGYEDNFEPGRFGDVLQKVKVALEEDLAPFEIEWILSTLLSKPVYLLDLMEHKRTDEAWRTLTSLLPDVFKLITSVVTKYDETEVYYEKIVKVCLLPYDSLTRQQSLSCLTSVVQKSPAGTYKYTKHLAALEEGTTCKARLALLIGTICEYHPAVVSDNMIQIWRVYLNLLDSNKYTGEITKSVLQGVCSLFKHFGTHLPTMELINFYDKLISCLDMDRCKDACLNILKEHANLFAERLSKDKKTRTALWTLTSEASAQAVIAVYDAVFTVSNKETIQNIIITEVEPHARSHRYTEKFTALRVMTDEHTHLQPGDMLQYVELPVLEYDVRNGNVNYETCEAITWCIQTNMIFSDRLIQTALLCYEQLPDKRRTDMLKHFLVSEFRTAAITALLSETCRSNSKDAILKIWQELHSGQSTISRQNIALFIQDVVDYAVSMMEGIMGKDGWDEEPLPDSITCLLSLLVCLDCHIIESASLSRVLSKCAQAHIQATPAAVLSCAATGNYCEHISLENIADDSLRLQCSISLLGIEKINQPSEKLAALQIIFSNNTVEASILSKAVHLLEKLLQQHKDLDETKITYIIERIQNLSKHTDKTNKDGRILHRDLIMFLGVYGKVGDENNNNISNSDSMLINKLQNNLCLNLPEENGNLKINLQSLLHVAIAREDREALNVLLTIICANLAHKRDEVVQSALIRVLVCLSHCGVETEVIRDAVAMCDAACGQELMQYIMTEQSSTSRKLLLEGLEVLLKSQTDEQVLENIIENILKIETVLSDQANIEILEVFVKLLRENNSLCKIFLPEVIIKILKIQAHCTEIFKMAAELFINKIELYDEFIIEEILENIFKVLSESTKSKMAANVTSKIKMALQCVKNILELKNEKCVIDLYFDSLGNEIDLKILAGIKSVFDLNLESCKKLVTRNDSVVMKTSFECSDFDDVLYFVGVFSEVLLDMEYEKTLLLISKIIENLSPEQISISDKKLSICLSSIRRKTKTTPKTLLTSFKRWFKSFPINEITDNIEKYNFDKKQAMEVNALKVMLQVVFEDDVSILMELNGFAKRWVDCVTSLNAPGYIERDLKSEMGYLGDLVDVSLRFLGKEDIVKLLLSDNTDDVESSGLRFFRIFLPATFKYLLQKPYILQCMNKSNCGLLNHIVKYALSRSRGQEVLDIVNELWPQYEKYSTFKQKHSLLHDLSLIPTKLNRGSNPYTWVLNTLSSEDTRLEHKIQLVGVLPGTEEYSMGYKSLYPALHTRLDSHRSLAAHALHAVHAAHAAHGHEALLRVLCTLHDVESSKGWWDDAIDACMSAVALNADMHVYDVVFERCWQGKGLGVCQRMLVPLLRYASPTFCEQFLSTVLERLLSIISKKPRAISVHPSYERCLLDYIRAFSVLNTVFEKIPKDHIESPSSVLYSKINAGDTFYYLVKTVCKLCVGLRKEITCPEDADDSLKNIFRLFQCANYNCLVAAICCRDPKPEVYAVVFDPRVWNKLVSDEDMELPLREQWRQRSTRQAVPGSLVGHTLRTARTPSTLRTRAFLRTLSENPYDYDLLEEEDQSSVVEIKMADKPLNRHECCATLSALVARGAAHIENTATALRGHCDTSRNCRWLLAQAICNSKEDLKQQASVLTPALLAVIVDTAKDGKLNDLHVDIIDTLIYWNEEITSPHLNPTIEYIIATAIDYRHRQNIHWTLLDKLRRLLEITGKCVTISWTIFEKHFADPKSDTAKSCLQILKRIAKCDVHIPELLPALTAALEAKRAVSELAELFGLALASLKKSGGSDQEWLKRYKSILEKLRRQDVAEYVKLIYYVQLNYPQCCDEANFRSVTDLLPKIVGREKIKCINILSCYVLTARPNVYVAAMFETVGLVDIITSTEALILAKNGLHLMEDCTRKQIVLKISSVCQQLPVKARTVAYDVILKAFELILSPNSTSEPAAKRPSRESNSPLLNTADDYTRTVLESLSQGVVDPIQDIYRAVREGVGKCLSKHIGMRFFESFLLAVHTPLTNTSKSLQGSISAMLDIFFHYIRNQEKIKNTKLRDERLDISMSTTSSNIMSSTLTKGNVTYIHEEDTIPAIDVQISLDDILQTILRFAERDLQAATCIVIQLMRSLNTARPGFDFRSTMGGKIAEVLKNISVITPSIIQMAREIEIWDSEIVQEAIDSLVQSTKGTEGENVCKLLQEDYNLRQLGAEQFILGTNLTYDETMTEVTSKFSMEDLTSSFGKLSNWDNLSLMERRESESLPPLWTNAETFRSRLEEWDFTDSPTWLKALVSAYHNSDVTSAYKCLRSVDAWPARQFDLSAVIETVNWTSIRKNFDTNCTLPTDILPSDCLAEWAMRIMIRSLFLQSLNNGDTERIKLSRLHELKWCKSANERGLYRQARECCKNVTGLYESETLQWFRQKVIAQRSIALQREDRDSLERTLNLAVTYTPQFIEHSNYEDILGMNQLILYLKKDLKSLKKDHIECTLQEIRKNLKSPSTISEQNKKSTASICELSLTYYDQLWDTCAEESSQNDLLLNMATALSLYVELNLGPKCTLLVDVLLDRLDRFVGEMLRDDVAEKLLDTLHPILHTLDTISTDSLKCHQHLFPTNAHPALKYLLHERAETEKYKKYLQLIGDAEYSLLQYCKRLMGCTDENEWRQIFDTMKAKIFENPHAGPDYQVLFKYKKNLYDIDEFSTDKQTKRKVLSSIQTALRGTKRETLTLSHLCPSLSYEVESECLNKLLGVRKGVKIVKFEPKVFVFVDAIRRPVVLTARLSDGSVARSVVKHGERAHTHCAALRLARAMPVCARAGGSDYRVTPLGDDCGLIEYLEHHERLKVLISSACVTDDKYNLEVMQRAKNDEDLILAAGNVSLQQFEKLCSKVPAYCLRSAIEANSVSLEDFIRKKKNFQESVCDMTVISYLYGIGDRHLENIMYDIRDGRARHVDLGGVAQWGVGGELPPARLTRNILAACDVTVLESRLQNVLTSLREGCALLRPHIDLSFKWMGGQHVDQLHHIHALLQGTILPHQLTITMLRGSPHKHTEKYVQLMVELFGDFERKDLYSVEEQVASLLRQCTEPRILSVTRTGWEPWI